MKIGSIKWIFIITILILAIGLTLFTNEYFKENSLPKAFAFGNGRIEATEVNIATKFSGRLLEIVVNEGDMVKKGQVLARLDTNELNAKLKQALAYVERAKQHKNYALAIVKQRESELTLAEKNLERSKSLYVNKNISLVQLQQDETTLQSAKASLLASKAEVISADASINATKAEVESIKVNIDESTLYSPINGRVLYKLAENGEVLSAGGKVLIILELLETYMNIFLPTTSIGRIDIGSNARIILDAIPNMAIPAYVSFISPKAQFTPKEIETKSEREKLMFRVKVKIDREFLKANLKKIKVGLPAVAYVRLDNTTPWPEELNKIPNFSNEKVNK